MILVVFTFRERPPIWQVFLRLMVDGGYYETLAIKAFACCFALGVFNLRCGLVTMVTAGVSR